MGSEALQRFPKMLHLYRLRFCASFIFFIPFAIYALYILPLPPYLNLYVFNHSSDYLYNFTILYELLPAGIIQLTVLLNEDKSVVTILCAAAKQVDDVDVPSDEFHHLQFLYEICHVSLRSVRCNGSSTQYKRQYLATT